MAQLIWLKVVAPFAVALLAAAAPASVETCKANAPVVTVGVDLLEPVIDNTLPQREIQALSPGYHGGRTVGLYSARIEAQSVSRIREVGLALERAPTCLSITAVEVHLTMPVRRIYVSKELKPETCAYAAVLGHERKHQRTDDDALREHAQRIRRAIERAVIDAGPRQVLPADRERARAVLTEVVQTAFNKAFDALQSARTALQAGVDAGLEYARVTASCSDWSTLHP